jgi:aryl-alcohol dehydrogenase-like predicted oxidoreductase
VQKRKLGKSGLQVAPLVFGGNVFGWTADEATSFKLLDAFVAAGFDFIDTADVYSKWVPGNSGGESETVLGKWLKQRGNRGGVVIATKVGWEMAPDRKGLSKAYILRAVEDSLRRLQTDYIDLYQIHWPDRYVPSFGKAFYDPAQERPTVPIDEQLDALHAVIQAGKVRYIGVSNETPWGVLEFLRLGTEKRLPRIVAIQNAYNLLNRVFEMGLSEVHRHVNVPLLAYSPLGFGHLTAKYLHGAQPEGARLTRFPGFGQRYAKVNVPEAVAAYAELARSAGCSPAALALAFVRSRWFVASTIIGATSLAQLKENLDGAALDLEAATLERIDEIHQRYPNPAL